MERRQLSTLIARAATLTFIAAIALLTAAPAEAQRHHARLSADLSDHLAAQSPRIDVIVHGTRAEVDALAARYNLVVKRYMKEGGVLRVKAREERCAALSSRGGGEGSAALRGGRP